MAGVCDEGGGEGTGFGGSRVGPETKRARTARGGRRRWRSEGSARGWGGHDEGEDESGAWEREEMGRR